MVNFTPILRPFLTGYARRARRWEDAAGIEREQRRQLAWLLRRGVSTVFGRDHGLGSVASEGDFERAVPVRGYDDGFRDYVMRMVGGEPDVLWPGVCTRFAQSSGTSGAKSKFIPVTADALRLNHFAGTRAAVAFYLASHPRSRLFAGASFILGGSFANELSGLPPGVKVGDLSAHLIDAIPTLGEHFRVPSRATALMHDWRQKLPRLVQECRGKDIVSLSGVPSWFLTVIRETLVAQGAETIHDLWPGLEVFFHGGIAFGPYRRQYEALAPRGLNFWENYNASEGFFATQDTAAAPGMRLLPDTGVFYEFIPIGQLGRPDPDALRAWEVQPGEVYALCITAPNGLWRYLIGDTVRIESAAPLRISISGRTSAFINAFGEEVMVWNTDAALAQAAEAAGAHADNYTVGPVYAGDGKRGCHRWLIEWGTPPADPAAFAADLDRRLCALNSDYQAKREGNLFLDPLETVALPAGTFDRWLAATGRLGGQRKVPRLSNSPDICDDILKMCRL